MTTIVQVREVMTPLLARTNDVALVGRFLIIKPVHHIMRGVFIDRSGDKNLLVPTTVADLLFQNRKRITLGWGERLYNRASPQWDVTRPETIEILYDMLETEVIPMLRRIISFDDFVAYASIIRPPFNNKFESYRFTNMLLAVAKGEFDIARSIWRGDEQLRVYLNANEPSFHPALEAGDRSELVRLFNRWEEQTVKTFKLEKVWERTPFPFELQDQTD